MFGPSQLLTIVALCLWVALVPLLQFEEPLLELPIVLRCDVSPDVIEACRAENSGCPSGKPDDGKVVMSCCFCVQIAALPMALVPGPTVLAPSALQKVDDPQPPSARTRSVRPPVPPPRSC